MKSYLLDSSFIVDLLNEIAAARAGAALAWLHSNRTATLWVSPVTVAEVLEGADDPDAVRNYLLRYAWQGIHRVHADRVAVIQRRAPRRMGENDAWQAAIAEQMSAVLVGHDPKALNGSGRPMRIIGGILPKSARPGVSVILHC